MKILFIICLLITIDTTHVRGGEKKVNVEKKGKFLDGKWLEEAVETTDITSKDGNKSTSKKATSNADQSLKKDVGKNLKPVSSSSISQNVTSTKNKTDKKFADVPKVVGQKQFSLNVISEINRKREHHGVKPLKSNEKYRKIAKALADMFAKSNDPNISVPEKNDYGQLIFYKTTNGKLEFKASDAVNNWYNEFENHDFQNEPLPGQTLKSGHFSQVIWKDTTEAGVAYARSDDKKIVFIVAVFYPRGNWVGEFRDQVLPLKEKQAVVEEIGSTAKGERLNFNENILNEHNYYRKRHNVGLLKLNTELSRSSQKYAEKLANEDVMKHSTDIKYGENLYKFWSNDHSVQPDPKYVLKSWYNEIGYYNYKNPIFSTTTGHFTQIVWKKSTEIGIGMAQNQISKTFYIVVRYNPPGNVIGQFPSNVLPISN